MRGNRQLALMVAAAITVFGVAAPAFAQTDIGWTWNNDSDQDAKARFESEGEHIYAFEYEGSDYVDYEYGNNTGLRWHIPGSEDKSRKDLNLTIAEGVVVKLQVCEAKTAAPDDCSIWKKGVA